MLLLFMDSLIRADSFEDYQQKLSSVVLRWPHTFTQYFVAYISPEIPMFAIWDFPTTEDSIFTSNQCENTWTDWQKNNKTECQVDVAFHIQCSRCDPVGDNVTWPRITLQKTHWFLLRSCLGINALCKIVT